MSVFDLIRTPVFLVGSAISVATYAYVQGCSFFGISGLDCIVVDYDKSGNVYYCDRVVGTSDVGAYHMIASIVFAFLAMTWSHSDFDDSESESGSSESDSVALSDSEDPDYDEFENSQDSSVNLEDIFNEGFAEFEDRVIDRPVYLPRPAAGSRYVALSSIGRKSAEVVAAECAITDETIGYTAPRRETILDDLQKFEGWDFKAASATVNAVHGRTLVPIYINDGRKIIINKCKLFDLNVVGVAVKDHNYNTMLEHISSSAMITEIIDVGGMDLYNRFRS